MHISHVSWAGIFLAFGIALRDCRRWPRHALEAWQRFRPVILLWVCVAFVFLAVNLLRFGPGEGVGLGTRTVQLLGLAVISAVLFCGGSIWVARAGHVGLFARIRRRAIGLPAPSAWRAAVETLAIAGGIILFSVTLLFLTRPSSPMRDWLESPDNLDVRSGSLILLILIAPLWEEIAFRWYLLNRIENALEREPWGRLAAIVTTSALWACAHAAWTDPAWVKLVQIFTAGCLLSWRFRVIGLSGCVLAHLALNSIAIIDIVRRT